MWFWFVEKGGAKLQDFANGSREIADYWHVLATCSANKIGFEWLFFAREDFLAKFR
jgi:hypothetical protein